MCHLLYSFLTCMLLIGIIPDVFGAQRADVLRVQLQDGYYQITEDEIRLLKEFSTVFSANLLKKQAVQFLTLSQNNFQLVLKMLSQHRYPINIIQLLKENHKETINQLYQLYENLILLDIEVLYPLLKALILKEIQHSSTAIIQLIKLENKEQWFVDAAQQRINQQISFKENMYTFVLKNNEVSEKSFAEKSRLEKLIASSELLKDYVVFTDNKNFDKPVYLQALSKKSFERVYDLVDDLTDPYTLELKLSKYSLRELAFIVNAADFLAMQVLIDSASRQLANKLMQEDSLKRFQEGRRWGSFLGLNKNSDHKIALLIADSINLVGKVYACTNNVQFFPEKEGEIISVSLSPDTAMVALGSRNSNAFVYAIKEGSRIHTFKGHTASIYSVAWSPDGKKLATGSWDDTINVWDVQDGKFLFTLFGHKRYVDCISWSNDGNKIATGSGDSTVKVWDSSNGSIIQTFSGHAYPASAVGFSPNGKMLATGSNDQTSKLFDVQTSEIIHTFTGHTDWVTSLAWNLTNTLLATGSRDKTVQVWDVKSGKRLKKIGGFAGTITSLAWSRSANLLVIGASDGTVTIWDCDARKVVQIVRGDKDSIFSFGWALSDSLVIVGVANNRMQLWRSVSHNDVRFLSIDEAMLIACVQKAYAAKKAFIIQQDMEAIFSLLGATLKEFLMNSFKVIKSTL